MIINCVECKVIAEEDLLLTIGNCEEYINKKNMAKGRRTKQNKTSSPNSDTSKTLTSILKDERFQHLVQDPRFRNIPKQKKKVKIDTRFQQMFTNEKFKVKYTVDKYGRKLSQSTSVDLKKYYDLNSSSESDENESEKAEGKRVQTEEASSHTSDEEEKELLKEEKAIVQQQVDLSEEDGSVNNDEEVSHTLKQHLLDPHIDYARGEGCLLTDSSPDDESTDDEHNPELYLHHVWGELDNDADTTEDSTKRLAVCNMDWDRIRAVDLMMLFSSFLPPCGSILSVKIYPSEFGKQRMAIEDLNGPPELVGLDKLSLRKQQANTINSSKVEKEAELFLEQDSDAEEGDDYHMEKLRQYQLTRLRYYYAVVDCDSVSTAEKIYRECDGIEYESSATRVDLRFISDDTTFEDEPKDICLELPDLVTYKPRHFITTALQQAKVDLTWDETALERRELGDKLAKAQLENVCDKDLRKIIAYDSEEEENEIKHGGEEHRIGDNVKQEFNESSDAETVGKGTSSIISKYKSLLVEINETEVKEKNKEKYEMEFTWQVESGNNDLQEGDVKSIESKTALTPIEKILQKRSEKNKKRKAERKKRKLLARGISSGTNNEESEDSVPEGLDMYDPYFAEEFESGDFPDLKVKEKENNKKLKKLKIEQSQLEQEKQLKQAQELEILLDDDNNAVNKKHFSLEKILKSEQELTQNTTRHKRRKQLKKPKSANETENKLSADSFQINVNDERFKAIFESSDFNIDPTHPKFKKTKATEQLIQEQLKRRHSNTELTITTTTNQPAEKSKQQLENNILIKSLKSKLQMKMNN